MTRTRPHSILKMTSSQLRSSRGLMPATAPCLKHPVACSSRARRRRSSQRTRAAAAEWVVSGFGQAEAPADTPGERFRVEVGNVGERLPQSFVFAPVLQSPSKLLCVTLPRRPLGVIFVPDRDGRVRIGEFVKDSAAGRAASVERLSPSGAQAPQVGDVLRAVTATVFSFTPQAQLLGDLTNTKRTVVLFGADGEAYEKVFVALRQGLVADGPVSMVLERPLEGSRSASWSPKPVEPAARIMPSDDSDEEQRWREVNLSADGPGSEVGGAIAVTLGLLVLLLAAGFSP
jgi:hypothetical protein